ncbi:KRAB-A domain-containing protein 2 [Trichinella zimbabwensis]|uniref:KRAB-A domain-containing protein 2 n=1 Tax=Trichinella zimbabwensis TaxID=268475 RepID=A0A0V1HZB2_9BILA|nr:KRAB-A domain-containing protein 2 [Trichinella zimbabwensis]
MKARFQGKLQQMLDGKRKNKVVLSASQHNGIIQDLLRINAEGAQAYSDYNLEKRFEVLQIRKEFRLIRKRKNENDIRLAAASDEIYDAIKTFTNGLLTTLPDRDFQYIMTYVNHFSKFCVLRPLKSKRAPEVASSHLDIFLNYFGAPAILQSDSGREFVNYIIAELISLWSEIAFVTVKPRHPQNQGGVERLNGIIQDKLAIWMKENNSKRWSMGLKFVQWQINISTHATTKQNPFKVMFGEEPSAGLKSHLLPQSLLKETIDEEVEIFFSEQTSDAHQKIDGEEQMEIENEAEDEENRQPLTNKPSCSNDHHFRRVKTAVAEGLKKCAVAMSARSKKPVPVLAVGQCATPKMPKVDRGSADPRNLLGVVLKINNGLHTVG